MDSGVCSELTSESHAGKLGSAEGVDVVVMKALQDTGKGDGISCQYAEEAQSNDCQRSLQLPLRISQFGLGNVKTGSTVSDVYVTIFVGIDDVARQTLGHMGEQSVEYCVSMETFVWVLYE